MPAEAPASAGSASAGAWLPACRVDELAEQAPARVDVGGRALCLVRTGALVQALLDECSHGQVALSEGEVEGGLIECWLHGSCFDLATGIPTGPPATVPVPVYPVRVVDGEVQVRLGAPA